MTPVLFASSLSKLRRAKEACTGHGCQRGTEPPHTERSHFAMHGSSSVLTPSIRSHFEVLYATHKLSGASDSTFRQYRASLNNFDEFLGRPATIEDLRDDLLHQAAHWLAGREKRRSAYTALKLQENLLAIWRFLLSKHLVIEAPNVKMIPVPELIPTAWTKPQLRRLWETCQKQTGTYCGVDKAGWWHGLHSVIWDTGERINAVLQCRWDNLDMRSRYLKIPHSVRKGKRADMLFRLHRDTILILRAIRDPERDLIFPWPLHPTSLHNHYRALLSEGNLPTDRYHKFHCLRRSTASYLEAAGGDATAQLGHEHRSTTKRYLDPRIVKQKHAADLLFRPGKRAS